tara:strand:- start:2820 stop:3401 length:582 start_codon:yes stop_codon:yes gene_type:complete
MILSVRQQANRIRKWYNLATPSQVLDGMQWYNDAHALAVELSARYGVTVLQAAQVISVLSPQKKWDANKREAVAMFNEHFTGETPQQGYFATRATVIECHAIIAGDFLLPIKRIKTYSFADNIAYPSTSTEVTIDRHALRVAYDDTSAKIDKVGINAYKYARQAYRQVADSLGIKAYQLQAIVWVTYKSKVNR